MQPKYRLAPDEAPRKRRLFGALRQRASALPAAVKTHRRDAARVAIQTAIATAATYLVMIWLDLPHMSWAIISALFTIHLSPDSTLRSGLGRFAGTVLGIVVGLLSVALVGGEGYFLLRLAIAVTVTNAIAAIWPSLNYAAVAAAIMALHPDPDVMGALERAVAILIGSAMGTAAAFTAWPDFGRKRTVRFIQAALRDSRELLQLTLQGVDRDDRGQRNFVHARFFGNLEAARASASQTWFRPYLYSGLPLHDALYATESLWHGLVVLDRAMADERQHLKSAALKALHPCIEEVQQASCEYVDSLVGAIEGQNTLPPKDALNRTVAKTRDAAKASNQRSAEPNGDRERAVHALIFALDEVERNLTDLGDMLANGTAGPATA